MTHCLEVFTRTKENEMPEITDEMVYSTGPTWWSAVRLLSGSPWGKKDFDAVRFFHPDSVADTLKKAYEVIGDERGVGAVIRAAYYRHGTSLISPVQMAEIIESFRCGYEDISIPLQRYIDDHFSPDFGIHDFTPAGTDKLMQKITRPGDIWVADTDIEGVWVFHVPQYEGKAYGWKA